MLPYLPSEDLVQFIWRYKFFNTNNLYSVDDESIKILDFGTIQNNAGPDVFNARVKIGSEIWVGNIELHVKTSDWVKHNHSKDPAYNIILHVVYWHDKEIDALQTTGVKTLELRSLTNEALLQRYRHIMENKQWIACEQLLPSIDEFTWNNWKERLLTERLEQKVLPMKLDWQKNNYNLNQSFFEWMAYGFGLKVNAQPFKQLAQTLSIQLLAKHKNNLPQLEALLLGQAGFLNPADNEMDSYTKHLFKEYEFLKQKYALTPLLRHAFKFSKLRPAAFPTIRLALLAKLIYTSQNLWSAIVDCNSVSEVLALLKVSTSEYWQNHYVLGKTVSTTKEKKLGRSAINTLMVNIIVPYLFGYGQLTQNHSLKNKALNWLQAIPPENNTIIRKWQSLGVKAKHAGETQALIQLKNNYCNPLKCLTCAVGYQILKT